MCGVVQTPAAAHAVIVSVVVQCHRVGVCDYQTWTLFTTQLHGLFVWNGHLFWRGGHSSFIILLFIDLFVYISYMGCTEAACDYLQPVMQTVWALVSACALNVEVVSEVKRNSEARFYRNDVLTGHTMRWGVGVSWAEQMSLWLIKYTTIAGYWEEKKKKSLRFSRRLHY